VSDDVRAHLQAVLDGPQGDLLPPHYSTCLGCGPDAPHGYHLQVRRDGDDAVVCDHVFGVEQSGAPGIAHGGAVATVADDVLGYLLYVTRVPGVTRRLEVDYLKPVLTGVSYRVRAQLDRRDGRKLFMSCTATDPHGVEAFRATGLFIVVGLSHFEAGTTSSEGRSPVAP
jgi:acyl-coenzyme A thioesterase PaaI-like protein